MLNEIIEETKVTKTRRLLFKVDFAKAYNSIDWNYVIEMLRNMNFPGKWISWVKECISTATANVLVNGSPSGEFQLERGLRQGDTLSPFLFLVAAEGLNALTKRAVREGLLKGVTIGRGNMVIFHLQYADDIIFAVEGTVENAKAVKWILKNFEIISGLSVNFEKSCAYGINVENDLLEEIANELGCRVGSWPIPYLGVKIGGGVNGVEAWTSHVERVRGRLSRWEANLLSLGSRLTLVKSVLSSILVYNLSFLRLPKLVEKKIKSIQCQFLWGVKKGRKRLLGLGGIQYVNP